MDRFAQFFICPLYTEALTEKEINAIESEHAKNLQADAWRTKMVTKTLIDKSHPYSKFGTGNKFTLWENTKNNNINIRQELINFQNRWYSANIMGLCVFGKESLDELEAMVVSKFSEVKNKSIEAPTWEPIKHDGEGKTPLQINVVPVKDYRMLTISFPCPDLDIHFRSGVSRQDFELIKQLVRKPLSLIKSIFPSA